MDVQQLAEGLASEEASAPGLSRAGAAFRRLRPVLAAIPDEHVQVVNLDVPRVVTTALGVWPKVRKLETSLRALPDFDVRCFEEFEERALALLQAETELLAVTEPEDQLEKLVEQALVARSQLIADLESLTAHGALRQVPQHCSARQRGHLGLAADLGTLATLFREHWALIENKTPLSRRELDVLSELSCRLMSGIGVRRHRKKNQKHAAALRARAFTHFVRAYDEVRRAVCYLRWHHDDADTIIRSLYAKRTRRRLREKEGAKAEQATAAIPTHEPSASLELALLRPGSSSARV